MHAMHTAVLSSDELLEHDFSIEFAHEFRQSPSSPSGDDSNHLGFRGIRGAAAVGADRTYYSVLVCC